MRDLIAVAALGGLLSAVANAAVTQEEADRLGNELTPVGAQMAGDKALGIPAWDGGLQEADRKSVV